MKRLLILEHFFPPTKTNALKKEISGAKQEYDESLSAYWTRFRRLVDSCPNHKFSEGDLLQYFYQGMTVDTKNLVNSSSGGGFSQNTVSEAKRLIQHLVDATREYDEPRIQMLKKAAQANSSNLDDKFEERLGRIERMLSTVVEKVATAGQPTEKPCGACGNPSHTSLQCTGDEEEYQAQANSSHNFYSCDAPLPSLPKRDQFLNNHNAPWRNHPNFRWRDPEQRQQQQPPAMKPPQQQNYRNVQQLQQSQAEQKVQIKGLSRQMSQLATSMNQLKGNNGALPSQVHVNPKENVNKITLRSGTELNGPTPKNSQNGPQVDSRVEFCMEEFKRSVGTTDPFTQSAEQPGLAKQSREVNSQSRKANSQSRGAECQSREANSQRRGSTDKQKQKEVAVDSTKEEQTKISTPSSLPDPKVSISVPFPGRLAKKKPEEELIDFVKIFGKLEVNLPFLQALKIPPFGKFVKNFIVGKSKATGKIVMGENVSAAIKKELPAKCKDPELVDTRVVIQLADRSCVHPEGLLENVLVSVNNFVYPVDFYVVRMS
ncbi:uncharacterized protein LOC131023170 [Salvia miltiorrhiza]|uniref:uncharacterized protein LOC131023170 n=1 Tax=Salvia miltiorrhiza TaxID=226208 RepID=UPI0025AC9116|nr:uncharacterized protein LOC131023170 [Salvia miltiorrhiza]